MKKRIGKLRDKLIVQGDKNLVKPYETHIKSLGGSSAVSKPAIELIDSIYVEIFNDNISDEIGKREIQKNYLFEEMSEEDQEKAGLWVYEVNHPYAPNTGLRVLIKTKVPLKDLEIYAAFSFYSQYKSEPIIVDDYTMYWTGVVSDNYQNLLIAEKNKLIQSVSYGINAIDISSENIDYSSYMMLGQFTASFQRNNVIVIR